MTALPEAHFGSASEVRVDWRDAPDPDPDDDLIVPTPRDVVMMLGFDPADVDNTDQQGDGVDAVFNAIKHISRRMDALERRRSGARTAD